MASWKKVLVSGSSIDVAGITLGGTAITSNASELNLLDGVSGLVKADLTKLAAIDASAAELNLLDGVTGLVQGDFTKLAAIDASAAEINQLDDVSVGGTSTGDIVTIDGSQTLTNKTIAASQVTEISNLTADEGAQLENIGSTTISATQWGYVGALNQGLTKTSNVQFGQVTGSTALFSGTVTANAFSGDGSGLTGVSGDFPTTHDVGISHDATKFSVNDGASKFISGSQIKGYVYGSLSGDLTATAAGVVTLANNSVDTAQLADDAVGADELASNAVVNASVASNAAIAYSKLAALSSGNILVGNGSNVATSVAMSGDVTISNTGATTIGTGAVENEMLNGSIADSKLNQITTADKVSLAALDIDGATALGEAPAGADLIPIDDGAGGTNKSMTVSNLESYMQSNLTFTTNTNTGADMSVSTLKTKLASNLGTATIGDANDTIVIAGNLTVQGTKTELQTANLNVEDQFILLDSGSGGGTDTGIIFGGSADTANSGYALGWDDSAGVFGISAEIASDATSLGTLSGKLGYIETSTAVPSSAPTRQGVGSIHVKTDDETIWIYS